MALLAEQNLNLCQYHIKRCESLMFLGDQFSRAGDSETAEQTYRSALEIVKAGFRKFNYPADRTNLWKVNDIIISRWLGVIGIASSRHEGGAKRFVGACVKAMQSYRSNDVRIIEAALNSLSDWTARVLARTNIANADVERAVVLRSRADQLAGIIDSRTNVPSSKLANLKQAASDVALRIEQIVKRAAS